MESPHPLKTYLQRSDVKISDLAEAMDVDRVTIWRWAEGKSGIDLQKALKLERLTNGAVKPSDFARESPA